MTRTIVLIHSVRKYLSAIFALAFFIGLPITFSTTLSLIGSFRQRDPHSLSVANWLLFLFLPLLMPIQTGVFGLASWTVFREKRSARVWGIAASTVFILWTLLPLILPPHLFWKSELLLLGTGLVGLIAFAWPAQPLDIVHSQKKCRLPGDGTGSLFDGAVELLTLLIYWRAYHWWMQWLRNNDLSVPDFLTATVLLTFIGLLIVLLHESGHTLVGLFFGMKLRAFVVGPFQWRMRDGTWQFHFEPRQILATSGATGVVPTTPDFPRSSQLCMLCGGVVTNAVTGSVALWFSISCGTPIQVRGDLALFGIFSLVVAGINLIPFRAADTYSDGAQIYQLFSKGPWGDFHRVVGLAAASLVTPVRPRDYDINAIHRAAQSIGQSRQGLLLRILAYDYFLDCGDLDKAAVELAQAGTIYNESAADAPVEFVTSFVFGCAYIWRDAGCARRWWAHVESKKSTHLSCDYWIAHAALLWMETDLKAAGESLEKARALTQKLPAFGAYDFERYRCKLLSDVLSATPVNQ